VKGQPTSDDKKWLRFLDNNVISDPADCARKFPFKNKLPRLMRMDLIQYDRALGGYKLTPRGRSLEDEAIDFQI
jgi:hypothetical protein